MRTMKTVLPLVALLIAMGYALGQLTYTPVKAESGTCCRYSSTCEGTDLCRTPANTAPCCDPSAASCNGGGYCGKVGMIEEVGGGY